MTRKLRLKIMLVLCLLLMLLLASISVRAQNSDVPGFHVQGRFLYDRFGTKVILVGVNKMVIYTDRDGMPAFAEIAKTGANVVRIVWLTEGSAEELDVAITNAIHQKLIPMVDCHDSTGKWELLPRCVDYWVRPDILQVMKKHEQYLLINIANEAGEGVVTEWAFRAAYELAINRMRHAGIHVPLIIDAQGFGQNINDLQKNGPYLIEADPDHNLMFSIHMWWPTAWRGAGVKQMVIDEIAQSVEMELPLIVAEFANKGPGCSCCIPYETIIEQCHIHEIGYLPWSWGPGNGDCAEMDMTEDGTYETLHGWGLEVAVTSTHSISAISVRPDWIVNATPVALPTPVPTAAPLEAPAGLISQGKKVSASSAEGEGLREAAVADGRLNTRWSSAWSDPQDITIDLGDRLDIGRIVLEWETAYGKEYIIQVSDDGESWTDVVHETNGDGGQDNHVMSVKGRFVRLEGLKRATEWGYSLWEFWVFDTADAPLPEISQTQEIMNTPDMRPDLVITGISWMPEALTLDAPVTLRAEVENQGYATAIEGINVTFTVGNKVIGQGHSSQLLTAATSVSIEAQEPWQPDTPGGFVMLAWVDHAIDTQNGVVEEQDENNNLQSTYGVIKSETAPTLETTRILENTPVTTSSPDSGTDGPTPTAKNSPQQTPPKFPWIWTGLAVLGGISALILGLGVLKRKR